MDVMQGDYGFTREITANLDLSDATVVRARFVLPTTSGLPPIDKQISPEEIEDSAIGLINLPFNPGDLPVPGGYQLEVYDETPGRRVSSAVGKFKVHPTLG